MGQAGKAVVTGAFGYLGKCIARRLLDAGQEVVTLTNSVRRDNPFGGRIPAYPFHWDQPDQLAAALEGARVLYNTYWIRYPFGGLTHECVLEQTKTLFGAARQAGVARIVHISIANPSTSSPLPYFRNKALAEEALAATGLSYAILRPTVLFGNEDILINNIAWTLRRVPVFGVFGNGRYRVQPIHVEDLAALAVEQGGQMDDVTLDAAGPETYAFKDMAAMIARTLGLRRLIVPVPASVGLAVGGIVGRVMGDVLLTRDEAAGLMAELLCVDTPPAGTTRLSVWAAEHADELGRHYASELARRKNREASYAALKG